MTKLIADFPDYAIDTEGKVFNVKSGKYRRYSVTQRGYCSVDLHRKGTIKRFLVHRLVAEAFIPNPNNFPQVNHIDENPSNNNVNNLEWCTAKYNMNYGKGAKTRHLKIDYSKPCYKQNAIINGQKTSKPVCQYDKKGILINRFNSAKEAERITGIDSAHIGHCCTLKRRTAGGYCWRFERSDDLSQYQS